MIPTVLPAFALIPLGLAVLGAIAFGVWDIRRQLSTRERNDPCA